MRKLMVAFVLFALSTPLLAKDPFAGTWKLNSEKTKYTAGAPPQELTAVIEEEGNTIHLTATGVYSNGTALSVKYAIPAAGGAGTVEAGDFDAISAKMVSKTIREMTYMKDGKQLRTRRMVLSKDGKSMETTVNGTDALGNQISGVDFFDRQ